MATLSEIHCTTTTTTTNTNISTMLRLHCIDPHLQIQVVEFQDYSTYARQDAMVMCLYTDTAIYYVYNHMHEG